MATSRIFIKGLPPNITEPELRKHFSAKDREITDVKLLPQRRIAYVGYKSQDDATSAIKYFNRSYIRMSKLSVETARPVGYHPDLRPCALVADGMLDLRISLAPGTQCTPTNSHCARESKCGGGREPEEAEARRSESV